MLRAAEPPADLYVPVGAAVEELTLPRRPMAVAIAGAFVTLLPTVAFGAPVQAPVTSQSMVLPTVSPSVDLLQAPLRLGMEGDGVRRFQEGLGHFVEVEVTGTFDTATAKAVRQFQRENHLPPDGVVGNRTYGVLWTRLFWEKNIALDLEPDAFYRSLPRHVRIDVNVTTQRIAVLNAADGSVLKVFPTSTGTQQFPTPLGHFKVTRRVEKPAWYPPKSDWAKDAEFTPPGPDNPIGPAFLGINSPGILMHGVPIVEFGTIGRTSASHGCMRMYPQDVWQLHRMARAGTEVDIHG